MTAAREKLDSLGWGNRTPGLFGVVKALVEDGERLQEELRLLRAELVQRRVIAGEDPAQALTVDDALRMAQEAYPLDLVSRLDYIDAMLESCEDADTQAWAEARSATRHGQRARDDS